MEKQNPPAYASPPQVAGQPYPQAQSQQAPQVYQQPPQQYQQPPQQYQQAPEQYQQQPQQYQQQQPQPGFPQQPPMAAQQPMGPPPHMQQPHMMPGQHPQQQQPPQYAMQGQPPMGAHPQQPMGQPPMAYQQPQMGGKVPVVVTTQPGPGAGGLYQTAMPLATLAGTPAPVDCPSCHQRGMTVTDHISGDCTHLWAVGLCAFTCFFCFVPYLMDAFKDVQHKCGKCGVHLATWKKSGGTQVHVYS